jgi:hypothetical protein
MQFEDIGGKLVDARGHMGVRTADSFAFERTQVGAKDVLLGGSNLSSSYLGVT